MEAPQVASLIFPLGFVLPQGLLTLKFHPMFASLRIGTPTQRLFFRFNFVVLGYFNFAFILYPAFAGSSTQGDWLRSLVFANLAD